MQMLAENDRGWVALDGNELIVGSKLGDPPKVRLTSPVNADGGGGGVLSFNVSRQEGVVCDGHQQDEIAMVRVEQAEDVRGQVGNHKAELNLLLADGSGVGDVVKPFACVWNAVTRLMPQFAGALRSAVIGGVVPVTPDTHTAELLSRDGKFLFVLQGDGNEVVYLRSTMQPLWDRLSWEASHR
jgi:hypothetical protein